jgi:hypothetical protein
MRRARVVVLGLLAAFAFSALGTPAVFASTTPVPTTSIIPDPDGKYNIELDGLTRAGVLGSFAEFYAAHPAEAIKFLDLMKKYPAILAWIKKNPVVAANLFHALAKQTVIDWRKTVIDIATALTKTQGDF